MNVVDLPRAQRVPLDAAADLRELADQIETGACTAVVWAAAVDGAYVTKNGSSLERGLVLASLLHDWLVRGFRA